MADEMKTNVAVDDKINPAVPYCVVDETEMCKVGEADLNKNYKRCPKREGHNDFIPVDDFTVTHLPDGYHDDDLFDLIKVIAKLTVKIEVRYVSPNRPDFWPVNDLQGNERIPYASSNTKGSTHLRVGTGRARVVTDHGRETAEMCKCKSCVQSASSQGIMGKISISTATHVVFDQLEADKTVCCFFYDKKDSPVVGIDGWRVEMTDLAQERCRLKCTTCNGDLVHQLHATIEWWKSLWTKVNDRYHGVRDIEQCAIMVSHPHGCPKQVSVGKWTGRFCVKAVRPNVQDVKFCYTTSSCPGSSGAPVYILGYDGWLDHGHSGVGSNGMNISGVGRFVV